MTFLRGLLLAATLPLLTSCFQSHISGSTSGSDVIVEELRNPGPVIDSAVSYTENDWLLLVEAETWDGWLDAWKMLLIGGVPLKPEGINPSALYRLTASGGVDVDADGDGSLDSTPDPVDQSWHAIVTGQQLLKGGYQVSALTDAVYRWLEPELDAISDSDVIRRLDLAAQLLVSDINNDGVVDYIDLLKWASFWHGDGALTADSSHLRQLQNGLLDGSSDATLKNLAVQLLEGRSNSFGSSFWRQAIADVQARTYTTDAFLYGEVPEAMLCTAGTTSGAARFRFLLAVNAARQLHGVAPVAYSSDYDLDVQNAAVIQAANEYISHFPATNDMCYTESGADASATGNLSLSSRPEDPVSDVIGWINDANNISTVMAAGHRRWVLNPFAGYTAYGQVDGYSVQKVFDFQNEASPILDINVDFVAFPFSLYPYPFLSTNPSRPTPWGISMIEDTTRQFNNRHPYFGSARVSVTRRSDGQLLATSDHYTDTSGIGVPNYYSWNVADWEYDTLYDVEITGIAMQSGEIRTLRYPVYIDYAHLVVLDRPLESNDQISGNFISGTLADRDDQDSYNISLEGPTIINGDSQFSNQAFFLQLYGSDKQLIAEDDDALSLNLPADRYTLIVSNCSTGGSCYSTLKNYTVSF